MRGAAKVTAAGGASREAAVTETQGLSFMPELHGYPSAFEVSASAKTVGSVAESRWKLTVSPGSVALQASLDRLPASDSDGETGDAETANGHEKRRIVEFSSKSELRMMRRLVSLDYSPWLRALASGSVLAMVTLTYPGTWQPLVPSAKAASAHLRAFRSRLERAIGPVAAISKREFQRRGAPHWHLMLPLPSTIRGEPTPVWMSTAWFEVVGSGDERHLRAGTGVDWSTGARAIDPVRTARYFASYSARGSKAYQHVVPELWLENGGCGRFWSIWRLSPAEESVFIGFDEFVQLRRLMRGLDRSKRRTRKIRVRRIDRRTGRIYYRSVTRRTPSRSLNQSRLVGGGLFTADGPALRQISDVSSKRSRKPITENMKVDTHETNTCRSEHRTVLSRCQSQDVGRQRRYGRQERAGHGRFVSRHADRRRQGRGLRGQPAHEGYPEDADAANVGALRIADCSTLVDG